MDALQWMGAIRKADKNNNNQHHSSPSINELWSEKLNVYKKQIHS